MKKRHISSGDLGKQTAVRFPLTQLSKSQSQASLSTVQILWGRTQMETSVFPSASITKLKGFVLGGLQRSVSLSSHEDQRLFSKEEAMEHINHAHTKEEKPEIQEKATRRRLLVVAQHLAAVAEHRVLGHDLLRLRKLRVDPRQLVHRRRDPQARHVRRKQLLVQGMRQYLRLVPRVLPRPLPGCYLPAGAASLRLAELPTRVDPLAAPSTVRRDRRGHEGLARHGDLHVAPAALQDRRPGEPVPRRRSSSSSSPGSHRRRRRVGSGLEVEEAAIGVGMPLLPENCAVEPRGPSPAGHRRLPRCRGVGHESPEVLPVLRPIDVWRGTRGPSGGELIHGRPEHRRAAPSQMLLLLLLHVLRQRQLVREVVVERHRSSPTPPPVPLSFLLLSPKPDAKQKREVERRRRSESESESESETTAPTLNPTVTSRPRYPYPFANPAFIKSSRHQHPWTRGTRRRRGPQEWGARPCEPANGSEAHGREFDLEGVSGDDGVSFVRDHTGEWGVGSGVSVTVPVTVTVTVKT
ncbi:hypothetical protein BHE74_00010081 [Ensete ventricosum]|nr:hypothetical protein BHE74_00010081 [Ensete ventricosum]